MFKYSTISYHVQNLSQYKYLHIDNVIQSFCTPDMDSQMKIDYYDRNFEQNEELGLNDMKTENYESVQYI